jgi:hypothetical protein
VSFATIDRCAQELAMTNDITRWEQQLRELRGNSQELSAALTATAQELRLSGAEPNLDLLTRLDRYRTRFVTLKTELRSLFPTAANASSLDELETSLASHRQIRAALDVVEAAGRLRHREQPAFAPLARVADHCTALKEQLVTAAPKETIKALQEGRHPLSALLQLVRDGASLSDERWETLQEVVANQYGRELTTAVIRGRVHEVTA